MNINVRGKNVEVTDALKEYVEKRLGKLDKYFVDLKEANVTLVVEKADHRVEVTIPVSGMILRGEETTGDMYSSIDLVMDKLERQLEKYKSRLSRKIRMVDVKPEVVTDIVDDASVIKTKRFAVKPMPVDEAVMQMNLIGHSFFVFSNAETEEVNVVYRRKDGKYGLIEPEY